VLRGMSNVKSFTATTSVEFWRETMLAKLRKLVLYLAVGSTVLLLVQAKGWIDSRNTGERVDEMIKASWLTANETALKLGLDSSFADKVVARDRLVRLQAMIANTKRMKSMDTLRLSYVEEHIAKMNAAIEVDEARQVLERRYDEAKRWRERTPHGGRNSRPAKAHGCRNATIARDHRGSTSKLRRS